MNVFVTLLLVALMGCPLVKAMPINGGMAHQFQPSLSAHAGLAVGLSMGIPLLAAPAENTQATPAAAAEKENEAPAEQPKEEAGMYTIPE
ncbi:hypothetical protein F9C07_2225567 [Aspergillus flavus]|uniref:Uncharacterized protein n=2 Tax=Aspergillus flavus TaxID=5059 RepID=A0A7U2QRD6_ASPFN|nr:hypothetical protein F9C07_2225567 [Aspergillus flavus]RAQ67744.1 hypothetical protein COH20_009888 [Aspergillus flavus]RAQ77677.1 hypothetical protein COH21_005813 [Aspergillus flavus]RMZ41567.1 hypothetical protein CA14_011377 [Aspergillus flavus]